MKPDAASLAEVVAASEGTISDTGAATKWHLADTDAIEQQPSAQDPTEQPAESSGQDAAEQPFDQGPTEQQSGQDTAGQCPQEGGHDECKPPHDSDPDDSDPDDSNSDDGVVEDLEASQRALVWLPAASRALLQVSGQATQVSADAFMTALAIAAVVEQGPVIVQQAALQAATEGKNEQLTALAAKPVPEEFQAAAKLISAASLQSSPGEAQASVSPLGDSVERASPTPGTLRSPFSEEGAQTEISAYPESSVSAGTVTLQFESRCPSCLHKQ